MLTCEVRLFIPKGCFTEYVSGMTVVDEIFCPPLYLGTYWVIQNDCGQVWQLCTKMYVATV
jgi:hypothetical protein